MIVGIETKFDSAHFLPKHEGKCRRLHGHTWQVKVEVEGKVNNESGFVIDFSVLKREVNNVLERFDHYRLNDILANPTCENVAAHIKEALLIRDLPVDSVEVREGDGGWARI